MAYTNSPLVVYTGLSPNHSVQRPHSIDRITPPFVKATVPFAWRGATIYVKLSRRLFVSSLLCHISSSDV